MNGLRQAQARAAWPARAVRIVVLASMLSGCSWFGGGSKPEASDQSASFPNLGTVPTKTPTTPSNAERQQIAQGLIADQQNAAYTAEQLTARANAGSVPVPEAPPPTPESASDGETTSTATSPAETASKPAEATQNQAQQSATAATNAASPQTPAPVPSTETASKPAADTANASSNVSPPTPSVTPPTVQQPGASANSSEAASTSTQPAAPSDPAASSEATNPQPSSGMAQPPPSLDLSPPLAIAPPPSVGATDAGGSEAAAGAAAPASPRPFTMASLAPASGPEAIVGSGRPVAIIFFADGSAGLSDRDLSVLRDVLLVQKQHGGHLRLVGHSSGSPASSDEARGKLDYDISLARAKAVSRALVKLGTPGDAIAVSAVGAKEPMFAETAPTGEAGNRRVEIFLDR
jgi:flagellar motor protein MotB